MRIAGLPDDEQLLLDGLLDTLSRKAHRNILRDNLMDGRSALDRWMRGGSASHDVRAVVGWPAKAVETLARRCHLEGFTTSSGDFDALGLSDLLEANRFLSEAPQAHVSTLVHSCSFQVVTANETDGAPGLVTRVTALNGTGVWDARARQLSSFVSVLDRKDGQPVDFHLYLPDRIYVVRGRAVEEVLPNGLGVVPVEPLVYKPRLGRPFGSSRISRAVIYLTQSAMRVVVRSEATADLYSAPGLIAFGLTSEQLAEGAWRQGLGNVTGIPDADSAPSDALARAQVQVIQQASQEPHIAQLRAWAQLFAGETSIPVSSLGISVDQANPSSAEAYAASREDLIAEAEDAGREWGASHVRTLQMAWAQREGIPLDELPDEVRGLRAKWRDPRHVSQSAAADAFTKLVGVMPWLAESDAALDMLGLDAALVDRLRSDKRRARASANIAALTGGGNAVTV